MSKIFYIIGPSSSGKDTLYKRILAEDSLHLQAVTMYTTRPIRLGEREGVEYHFVDEARFEELEQAGRVIESRVYNTVHGLWKYFTVASDEIAVADHDYLMIGVVESFVKTKQYFGEENVIPIYIQVDDGVRLQRALEREMMQENPKYKELCRRYLADLEDFSEENMKRANISKQFVNHELELCVAEIVQYIASMSNLE